MDLLKMIDFFVIIPEQDQIYIYIFLIISFAFEGTNTLIILDDCAASKDVKKGQMNSLTWHLAQDIRESAFGS